MTQKDKITKTVIISIAILAFILFILFLVPGCSPQNSSGGNTGGNSGGGTQYIPAPCTKCGSYWDTKAWVCTGTCDNGGVCNNVGMFQSTDPYRKQECTCNSQTTQYTCSTQGGILSVPTCGGTCPEGQSCTMSITGTCSCMNSQRSCTSIVPYTASDCGQGTCSTGGRCGFIASTGGQGIGYCVCSML